MNHATYTSTFRSYLSASHPPSEICADADAAIFADALFYDHKTLTRDGVKSHIRGIAKSRNTPCEMCHAGFSVKQVGPEGTFRRIEARNLALS